MNSVDSGLAIVPGYKFSAIECGIRYENRLDYSLIVADKSCNASGVFTKNLVTAAPVRLCRERINSPVRAILINATNANACTGDEGLHNAADLTADIAKRLNSDEKSILMASTGVIGRQLPVEKMINSHEKLVSGLSHEKGSLIPRAIMTTDTVPKEASIEFQTEKGTFHVAGTAKGSGMIAPDMATLLAFIITDAPVSKADLDDLFKRAIKKTLNSITIDGDMSTNDTALILSPISDEYLKGQDLVKFSEALESVLFRLGELLVRDAEGATKFIKIRVKNAASDDDAKKIAKSISESLLVKTAFFGNDPNWGRIACAAGYSGAHIDEKKLSILFGDMVILSAGQPVNFDKDGLRKYISGTDILITVDIGTGTGAAEMMTCDISHDYVKINAEYST